MSKFYLVDEAGRKVSHIKRSQRGPMDPVGSPTKVSVWFDGDTYYPTVRSARANNRPFTLSGATKFDERVADSWIKSLAKLGRTFKAIGA